VLCLVRCQKYQQMSKSGEGMVREVKLRSHLDLLVQELVRILNMSLYVVLCV
jgi:hypothetical protein